MVCPLVIALVRKLAVREFGSDLLAGLSILISVIQGEYLVGSIVVLMLSGGTALEEYTSRRASSILDTLANRMPQTTHRRVGTQTVDVFLNQVEVGDFLIIYPHEVCPADGVVVEGHGRMNEAFLTGEPFEVSKAAGSKVISGALNGETVLTIRADKLPVDSRYARIMHVMEQTQQRRPRLRRLGDQLGAWYTPVAVLIALLAWMLSMDSHRFLAVLVIATPCPLLIAIPVAIIGAISLSTPNILRLEQRRRSRSRRRRHPGVIPRAKSSNSSTSDVACVHGACKAQSGNGTQRTSHVGGRLRILAGDRWCHRPGTH